MPCDKVIANATEKYQKEIPMSVRMIRAKIKADKVAELEKAAQEMFTAIEAERPPGVRYASSKLPDGVTFVILLGLDDDENNPLGSVPAFRDFQENLKTWIAGPPAIEQLTPVGSYRLF
jgi:quinol monooxygenase YgiN